MFILSLSSQFSFCCIFMETQVKESSKFNLEKLEYKFLSDSIFGFFVETDLFSFIS
jgi:hypothetical protein